MEREFIQFKTRLLENLKRERKFPEGSTNPSRDPSYVATP